MKSRVRVRVRVRVRCNYLSFLRRLGVANQLTLDRACRPHATDGPARDGEG